VESNWRMGAITYELGIDPVGLCARLQSSPLVLITSYDPPRPGEYEIYHSAGGDLGYVGSGPSPIPAAHPHFPYGWSVVADH